MAKKQQLICMNKNRKEPVGDLCGRIPGEEQVYVFRVGGEKERI